MLNNNSKVFDLLPLEFYLSQNYPNPFNEKTTIKFCVPYRTRVLLTVYNSEGEMIEKLVDEEKLPGTYEVVFSARGDRQLAIGNYYYCFEAGDFTIEKSMQKIS